jgi:polygalacturonase
MTTSLTRRRVLAAISGAAALRRRAAAAGDPWAMHAEILRRIQAPQFPARSFAVTSYGAKPDGKTDCTEAFGRAIEACRSAGGGSVHLAPGVYLSGAIHLKSNVNLVVEKGATIKFYSEPRYYPIVLTRFEGMECMNYSALIYAFNQSNLAVSGEGTLDGQADQEHWWPWKGNARGGWKPGTPNQLKAREDLVGMVERGVPVAERVMGHGSCLRPMFFQPYRCTNVLIEGVSIVNSPMYEVHPVLCSNVTVRNVKIISHGPNNDGCDPESSKDVLIEGCTFDTGDDCIAIKSGRNADGRRLHTPSENLIVQNCQMKDGHGGVTMGSECSGGIRNVFVQDCRMDSPNLDRVLRFKDNATRGGTIEHVYLRNVQAGQVAGPAIEVDFYYEEGEKGAFTPVVRDVEVVNLTCKKSQTAWTLRGFAKAPVRDVRIRNCVFESTARPNVAENVEGLVVNHVTVNGSPV